MNRPAPFRFVRRAIATCAWLLPLAGLLPAAHAAEADATTALPSARVIVKFKADSSLRRQALSAGERHVAQATALGQRIGHALGAGSGIDERSQVVTAVDLTSEALAAQLAQQPDVEYAVVDQRRRRAAAPNDPLYAATVGGNPAVGQWYLRAPDATTPSAINAEAAWAVTTGSASIVVADIDTGVRFDHVDLKRVSEGGNLLPGYDMITNTANANDGDGRDADPSDPGDWITATENARGTFAGCGVENSSWHGTQTAGLIGAMTNNAIGMASVGRTVRVLPVRVLGKCGGDDSDIIAGILWAAGISVPGVPDNPNPARVINMSLGGAGTCTQAYRDAISRVNALGVVVVAAAGNDTGHPVSVPGNCPGVIAVAGVRQVGSKVGFSNIGPEVSLSAPGGNCVNTAANTACLYPILTTSNSGTTTPVVGGSIYTDSFNSSLGTSFSSPLVAGTAALMLSVQPTLTPTGVLAQLKATARAFPTTGATNSPDTTPVVQCVAPSSTLDQDQCYCTTTTCGAGMLDANAAVLAVANVQAQIGFSPSAPTAGQAIALTGSATAASGHTITSYLWTISADGGTGSSFSGATNAAAATVTPTAGGQLTVKLTVTDNAGVSWSASQNISVQAVAAPSSGGGGDGGALGLGWLAALGLAVLALQQTRRPSTRAD
jgi:serine protease